jgi:NADH-quinone oxidoreductase subunit N
MIFFLSELYLFIGIFFIFVYYFCSKNKVDLEFDLMLLSVWILVMCLYVLIYTPILDTIYVFDYNFVLTPLSKTIKIAIYVIAIIIIILSQTTIVNLKKNVFEFYIFILLFLLALFLMMASNNLLLVLIFLEIQSMIAYTLTGLFSWSNLSKEALIKFYIIGAITAAFMGFGLSIIYSVSGTLNLIELLVWINKDEYILTPYLTIGFFLLWSIILFKLAIVPFHFWIADVYQGAPLIVTLFFATISKIGFLFLFFKLYFLLNINFLICLISLSIIYGTIMSLYQINIIRLIAFSSMVNIAFVLISFIINDTGEIGFCYIITYSFLNISLFLIQLIFQTKKNNLTLIEIIDFSKIMKINFIISLILIITFLSMAGIPPLAGFFIKWYVFNSLIKSGNLLVTFFLMLISIINSIYYIRLVRYVYLNSCKDLSIENFKNIPFFFLLILVLIFILNICFVFIHIYFFAYFLIIF